MPPRLLPFFSATAVSRRRGLQAECLIVATTKIRLAPEKLGADNDKIHELIMSVPSPRYLKGESGNDAP
jgi:hypothetical protein